MSSLVYYLIQVFASSGILYGYYHLFLRNKKFHQYNRFFLLGTVIISISVPFLHIPVYFSHEETASSIVVRTLTILSPSDETAPTAATALSRFNGSSFITINLIYCFYVLVAGFVLARLLIGLLRIRRISNRYPVEKLGNIRFVNTNDQHAPFSFFNWLFWRRDIELQSAKGEQVFRHELFHIRQRHSLDIVFMEIVSLVFWINPFFHLIKKEIRAIHEFLADQYALDKGGQWNYAETLLMHALQTKHSLVNPFFHNQIKRRIAMITNSKKTSHQYLRKMLVLPLAAVIITLFAFSYQKDRSFAGQANSPVTVIIDAGHGGIDPGVKSPDEQFNESDLTLSMAKIIRRLAPEYNVTIVMTRDGNGLPGGATNKNDGLKNRVEIAKAHNATMFISLHVNSAEKNDFQNDYSGIEAYVTNKRANDPGKAAASAILQELSSVYKTASDIKFRTSTGVYVLDKNDCATVLLECGYINNRQDLDFITKEANQEKIARGILKGIVAYSNTLASKKHIVPDYIDSVPNTVKVSADIKFAEGFSFRAENITMITEETPPGKSPDIQLIVFNGELLNLAEAKQKFSSAIIRDGKLRMIAPDNKEAIAKYGERAKGGVLVIENANIERLKEIRLLKGDKSDPLVVINNEVLPATQETMDRVNNLEPNTIRSINVLKGQSATDKYQEKGANGVIEITTKDAAALITKLINK